MYIDFHVKYSYSCHIIMKLEFFDRLSKNLLVSNFMKIRPVGAELRSDGWTDGWTEEQTNMTNLIVSFRNFAKAPKI
jgi:hypothetical protein